MAFFGPYPSLRLQLGALPMIDIVIPYLDAVFLEGSVERARILNVPSGDAVRQELAAGVFAIEQAYTSRPRPDGSFEAHRKYIDVQVIVAGAELIEVVDLSRLEVTRPYDAEKDVLRFADPGAERTSVVRLDTGDVAVFFLEDCHMPCLAAGEPAAVWKTVLKVPVPA